MKHWILDAIDAAKSIRRLRKMGYPGKIDMISREELDEERQWMEKQRKDVENLLACVRSMIKGGSACAWCECLEDCKAEGTDTGKACPFWCLKFPGEEDTNDPGKVRE